jgi:ubiquinone/menaquinone biosynthesis methyltransferase
MSRQASSTPHDHATQFGYTPVDEQEKQQRVGKVFHAVAKRYDLMNDVMSGGLHRQWKRQFVGEFAPLPGKHYLDMAGGTGDIAFRMQDAIDRRAKQWTHAEPAHITVADINPSMLQVGQERAMNQLRLQKPACQLTFTGMNAEALPVPDAAFHGYTIAFGIRNVTHIDQALKEAYRSLKPGGQFACLEFCPNVAPALQTFYDHYSFRILPAMGRLLADDADAYRYLAESIRLFPPPERFADMIRHAGFERVTYTVLPGSFVAIHQGWRL